VRERERERGKWRTDGLAWLEREGEGLSECGNGGVFVGVWVLCRCSESLWVSFIFLICVLVLYFNLSCV